MKKQSRTVRRRRQSTSPSPRHLPLVEILIDTQAELQELVVASGLKVLEAMLEEDRTAVCGPRYAHQPERQAYRAGHTPSQVVLGGRKVAMRRPRARRDGTEVPLPTARAFTDADPLNRRVVDQMLIGVATRQYVRSLEPLGADVTTRGTSKSAVSRRFVAQTQAKLRLADAALPPKHSNLHIVVLGHARPGQRLPSVGPPHLSPKVASAELLGRRRGRAGPAAAKGGPGVERHRQSPVPRRRPQRLDVHPDEQREHG